MIAQARYLVHILAGRAPRALLFDVARRRIGEMPPQAGAARYPAQAARIGTAEGSEWDDALAEHSPAERAAATVYRLERSAEVTV